MLEFPVIPGCKILSELGEGGVATVYLGIQEKLDRKVAIKVLHPEVLKDGVKLERFKREAKAVAMFRHSNIVPIFDTGDTGEYHYIVMEYLEESLKDRMVRYPDRKMPPDTALKIVEGIMKALDYAHFRGIYHRDIKPDNIMFKPDDTPVLVDFGIARVIESKEKEELTKAGTSLGTAYYISPEQARGQKDVDGRSDIYSLGVILFEMLTGKKPYDQGTWMSIMLRHMTAPVPTLPGELSLYQPLIDKMMAKDRKKRLSSGAIYIRVLNKIQANLAAQPGAMATPSAADIKRLLKHYWESIIDRIGSFKAVCSERLGSFMKVLKEKLDSSIKNTIKKVDPIIDKPMVKRVVLIILPGMVVAILFLLVILAVGSKHAAPPSETPISFNEILEQVDGYFQKVRYAKKLFENGDLKSLRQALGIIARLKKILATKGLEELKDKVTNRMNMLNQEFQGYLDQAMEYYQKSDYAKAAEFNLKAKQINPDAKDVQTLDELIKKGSATPPH